MKKKMKVKNTLTTIDGTLYENDIVFVEELPHTATGKLLKTGLREDFKNHLINK